MPNRMHDTDIWEEDWFIDLPNEYKLFYLYIKDKCDHSGMWRPNKRKFSMVVNGKIIMYDEFLKKVNIDPETGGEKKRIWVLPNGKWWISRFISFQLGGKFIIRIGAHRGALKLLVSNGIHPKEVSGMDWSGMDEFDMQELKEIAYGKGLYNLSLGQPSGKGRLIEREREPEQDSIRKGGVGENQKLFEFSMQKLYDTPFQNLNHQERDVKGVSEVQFSKWREFVDWTIQHNYTEIFKAIFVTPADFTTLYEKHGFVNDIWEAVVKKMLSTGIKKEQNLYFRIQDFIKYTGNNKRHGSSMSAGSGTSDYNNMDKW